MLFAERSDDSAPLAETEAVERASASAGPCDRPWVRQCAATRSSELCRAMWRVWHHVSAKTTSRGAQTWRRPPDSQEELASASTALLGNSALGSEAERFKTFTWIEVPYYSRAAAGPPRGAGGHPMICQIITALSPAHGSAHSTRQGGGGRISG